MVVVRKSRVRNGLCDGALRRMIVIGRSRPSKLRRPDDLPRTRRRISEVNV
jgi:hypothetical protein